MGESVSIEPIISPGPPPTFQPKGPKNVEYIYTSHPPTYSNLVEKEWLESSLLNRDYPPAGRESNICSPKNVTRTMSKKLNG